MNRILLAFVLVFSFTAICAAQSSTIYYPHIVNGNLSGHIYKTTIFLTNPAANGSAAVTGQIALFRQASTIGAQGTPYVTTFTDSSGQALTGSSIPFSLAGGQSVKLASSGTGQFETGFAMVTSSAPVAGTATFADFDPSGRLTGEAGVPAVPAVPRQTVFVDTVGGYSVGVAYANPAQGLASVTLNLLNTAGVSVATTTQTLGASNHYAAFTGQMFSAVTLPPMAGTMQITSNVPVAAIALRYDPAGIVFTTLPPVTIASLLSPTADWLSERPWMNPLTSVARLLSALGVRIG